MPKNIALREMIRRFRLLGFSGPFSGGRHMFMMFGTLKIRIPNPHWSDISRWLVAEILRQANIDVDTWEKL
jgi:hypothetical protein